MTTKAPFDVTLRATRVLTPGVRELTFERTDGSPLAFVAGQWMSVDVPAGAEIVRRSYSIASPPDGSPRFEIAVTKVDGGPGSTALHALAPGAVIKALGPQGFFTRPPEKTGPSLFVGTGTGITPLRSMLKDAVAKGDARPLWLMSGVRTEDDLLYRGELDALAAAHANVRVFYTLSRGNESWSGRRGYVQTHVRELYDAMVALGQGAPHVYICGLERMVSAVREVLRKEMGLPRELVHSERYD